MAIDLKDIFDYVAPAPAYLEQLKQTNMISQPEIDKLRNRSLVSGLLTAGLGYLAQPKNQRYGSALPYLGKAGLMGLQAAQQPYDQFAKDMTTAQQITDLATAREQRNRTKQEVDKLISGDPSLSFLRALPTDQQSKYIVESRLQQGKPTELKNTEDRYASAMFGGLPYGQLNPQQQQEVLDAITQEKIKIEREGNLDKSTIGYSFDVLKELREEANNSRNIQKDIFELERMLNDIYASGEETGPTEQLATKYESLLNNLGIKKSDIVGKKEYVNAIAQGLAKKQRTPGEGIMTDADFKVFENIVPGLGKTEEANRYLIESMKKLANRNIQVNKMANEYYVRHGYLKPDFFVQLDAYFEANPLFTLEEVEEMEALQDGKTLTKKSKKKTTKGKTAYDIVDDMPPSGGF